MEVLTERQKLLLAIIVQEFTQSAQPVGSKSIQKKYKLDMSPATIRNEMALLVDNGYLRQPHTSAGRVPTEEGYRYFVRQLMGNTDLPVTTKETISHQFYQARQDTEEWMRLAASILATQSNAASLVTAPQHKQHLFKHLELISVRSMQVLMVLVMNSGELRQQMLTLAEPFTQEELSTTAQRITNMCQGLSLEKIRMLPPANDSLTQDLLALVSEVMEQADGEVAGKLYRDGLLNVLNEPEFSENETARRALRVLEERPLLEDLLSQTIKNSEVGGIQVIIGGDGGLEELSDCSIILSRYGVPDSATGMLGVLGPIRMRYGRSISTVRYISRLLSAHVQESQFE